MHHEVYSSTLYRQYPKKTQGPKAFEVQAPLAGGFAANVVRPAVGSAIVVNMAKTDGAWGAWATSRYINIYFRSEIYDHAPLHEIQRKGVRHPRSTGCASFQCIEFCRFGARASAQHSPPRPTGDTRRHAIHAPVPVKVSP